MNNINKYFKVARNNLRMLDETRDGYKEHNDALEKQYEGRVNNANGI